MPSLIRFIVFCGILGAIAIGAMYALVSYVEPNPREIQVRISKDVLNQ